MNDLSLYWAMPCKWWRASFLVYYKQSTSNHTRVMQRCTPRVQFLASATTSAISATMSSRPSFSGGRGLSHDGRRNYSDRSYGDEDAYTPEFVNGDSHFQQVRVTYQGFRPPQYGGGSYSSDFHSHNYSQPPSHNYNQPPSHNYNQPPPYNYNQPPQLNYNHPPPHNFSHPPPPNYTQPQPYNYNLQYFDQNGGFDQPQTRHESNYNQQFRPQWQQQFRPRPPKQFQYRNWEYASPGPPPQCERFTILSYNILADYLIRDHWSKLYFHIPNYILDWKQRKRSIVFELGLWSADILCFQEVDRFADLKEELELQGYNGIWKRRTGVPVDGCAIFWRNSRFKLLHEESLEFCKLGMRDNVAQICVFQSLDQCKDSETSASTSSSNKAEKVVICNIHVLFNPKRGEMKLGQVRVLLNRAHAVSTLWDDAPIVICGDFNCTPKSALYNFIAEQKLDLSELSRDKVSGQASAEIYPSRPYPNSGAHDYAPASSSPSNIKAVEFDSLADELRAEIPGKNQGNEPSTNLGQPEYSMVRDSVECCINKESDKGSNCKPLGDSLDAMNRHGDENDATNHLLHNNLGESPSLLQDNAASSSCLPTSHALTRQKSSFEDAQFDYTNGANKDIEYQCHSKSIMCSDSGEISEPVSGKSELLEPDSNNNDVYSYKSEGKSSLESSFPKSLEDRLHRSVHASSSPSPLSAANQGSTSTAYESGGNDFMHESIEKDFLVDGKLERLSLDEVFEGTTEGENIGEDASSFLSELYSTCGPFPSHSKQAHSTDGTCGPFPSHSKQAHSTDEFGYPLKEQISTQRQQSNIVSNVNLDVTDDLKPRGITPEGSKYDPSTWTPVELETATGSAHCSVMEHPLKLRSVYGEIQDYSGTRDSTGEPAVTSYHRRFLGTVDYIWRSEGLQTVRVLAPIPKHAMLWTRGFPTKKWASDHIALVSELAFTNDTSNQNPETPSENA